MLSLKNTLQTHSSLIGTISLPQYSKMYEKELNLDIAKPRYHGYSDQILPVPWSSLFGDSTLNENNGKNRF